MPDELNTGSAPEADDLRTMIGAAWDEDAKAQETPPVSPEPKEPVAEPQKADDRPRDEQGRFAPKSEEPAPETALKVAKEPVAAKSEPAVASPGAQEPNKQTPAQAVAEGPAGEAQPAGQHRPPPGWSVAAKAAFDKLPEPVQAAVAKREEEISNGFAKLAEYKGLDEYVSMARENGKALPEVLKAYINAENMLQADPINAIAYLARQYKAHPVQLIAGIARSYGIDLRQLASQPQGAPNQPGAVQPPGFDPRLMSHFQALESRQRTLEETLRQQETLREQAEQESVNGEIGQFAAKPENKYFDNVRETMGQLINTGAAKDLPDAYEKACWAHPEIRQLFINEQIEKSKAQLAAEAKAKSEQAKRTSKSLSPGAPITGSNARGVGTPNATVRDEIEAAWNEAAA